LRNIQGVSKEMLVSETGVEYSIVIEVSVHR